MKTRNTARKTIGSAALATAAAALFMAAPVMAGSMHDGASKGKCMGGNACKGQSACKTANSSCKGMNSCKGEGYVMASKAKCKDLGGKFVAVDKKKMRKMHKDQS